MSINAIDYKTGTIEVADMENYPKNITMEELIEERTKHLPRYDIEGCSCDENHKCGCGGC